MLVLIFYLVVIYLWPLMIFGIARLWKVKNHPKGYVVAPFYILIFCFEWLLMLALKSHCEVAPDMLCDVGDFLVTWYRELFAFIGFFVSLFLLQRHVVTRSLVRAKELGSE